MMQNNKFSILFTNISNNPYKILLFFLFLGFFLKIVYLFGSPIWRVDLFFYIQGAQTIANGDVLYKHFGEIKSPGIFFLYYTILKIFGQSLFLVGIKITAMVFQTLTAWFFYKVGKQLFSEKIGFFLGSLFLVLISVNFHFWPANIMLLFLFPLAISLFFLCRSPLTSKFEYFLSAFFLGIAFLLSTNVFFYCLLYPVLAYNSTKSIGKTLIISFISAIGFIISLFPTFLYLWHNDALSEWYWWNIEWASIYGGAYPFWLRIWKFIYGIIKTWEWIPFYFLALLGIRGILKNLKSIQIKNNELFILTLFFCAFFSRMLLGKDVPRYYLYILPGLLFALPYGWERFTKIRWSIHFSVFILFIGLLLSNYQGLTSSFNKQIDTRLPLYDWIRNNSEPNDKIFVWYEGYEYYYMTDRKMATSFFSTSQHLDYPYIWEMNKYKDIDRPWNQFLKELTNNSPKLIIDPTGNFSSHNISNRGEKLKNHMDQFLIFVHEYYQKSFELGKIQVWKKK